MSMGHVSTHQLGIADLIRVERKNRAWAPAHIFFFSSACQIHHHVLYIEQSWKLAFNYGQELSTRKCLPFQWYEQRSMLFILHAGPDRASDHVSKAAARASAKKRQHASGRMIERPGRYRVESGGSTDRHGLRQPLSALRLR